jgi:hypothetical protein
MCRLLQKAILGSNDPILLISGLSNFNPTVGHSASACADQHFLVWQWLRSIRA